MRRKKKGAVGIGTLIIFIAMVLVAAVAAAVLINVSGILQQKSMATGKEAIQSVSSNIIVASIRGFVANPGVNNTIDNFSITISAAAGAGRLDLTQLVIKFGDNNVLANYNYSSSAMTRGSQITMGQFTAIELRDPSNLFTASTPVIDGSSLVQLNIPSPEGVSFVPRSEFHIELIPEFGAAIQIESVLPNTFPRTIVNVYP